MEDYRQFSAKNKNEAITKACIELGTTSDDLDIIVISEGTTGFFGFGAKPAVIKARRKEESAEEQEMKAILGNVSIDSIKGSKKQAPKQQPKENRPKADKKPKENQPKDNQAKENQNKENESKSSQPKENKQKDTQPKENKQKDNKAKENRQKEKPKDNQAKDSQPKAVQPKEVKEEVPEEEKPVRQSKPIEIITDEEVIKEVEKKAADFLRDVFASMDLGEVEIKSAYNREDGSLEVDFEGDDMGVLIGKRGQTLDSLQYLTSLVVNKGKDKYIRVKLDTEDYRRRRKDTLENLAKGIAYKVKKTRRPVVLEPMNPYERRIIHSALQGNKFVETISEGEEPYRHIVVKMKRNRD